MINDLINLLMNSRTNIKIYHWSTKKYNDHIITNDLINLLDDKSDKIVECILSYEKHDITNITYKFNKINNTNELINYLMLFNETLNKVKSNEIIKNLITDLLAEILKAIFLLKKIN
jgi:hypothetical protein